MNVLSRSNALVLGYGLYRNHTEEPWFRAGDLNRALPIDDNHPYKPIAPSTFTLARDNLKAKQMVETSQGSGGLAGNPSENRFVKVTPLGEEHLLDSMLYVVRHQGLTVPGILEIPDAIEAFLQHTDFKQRLVEIVTGVGRTATSTSTERTGVYH